MRMVSHRGLNSECRQHAAVCVRNESTVYLVCQVYLVCLVMAGNRGRVRRDANHLYSGASSTGSTGIQLQSGQAVSLTVGPPAGASLYVCRRKGHANMTGTLVVE
jgi:plastocyanin